MMLKVLSLELNFSCMELHLYQNFLSIRQDYCIRTIVMVARVTNVEIMFKSLPLAWIQRLLIRWFEICLLKMTANQCSIFSYKLVSSA